MARWITRFALAGLVVLLAVGCRSRTSAAGFELPEGNPDAGRVAFTELGCTSCHEVRGATGLPAPSQVPPLVLGGAVVTPPTNGQLTTGILNPSAHYMVGYPKDAIMKDGKSRMPDLTERITARQLADLVAFLQQHYEQIPAARPVM